MGGAAESGGCMSFGGGYACWVFGILGLFGVGRSGVLLEFTVRVKSWRSW